MFNYYLLIETPGSNLAMGMHHLNSDVSRWFNGRRLYSKAGQYCAVVQVDGIASSMISANNAKYAKRAQ